MCLQACILVWNVFPSHLPYTSSDTHFYQHNLFGPFDHYNLVWLYVGFELQTELFLTAKTTLGRKKLAPMFVYSVLES